MNRKEVKQFIIIFTSLFFSTSIVFGTFEGDQDGKTLIGFPFIFSSDTGGKCYDCEEIKWFKPWFLVLDALIIQVVTYFTMLYIKHLCKK